MAKNFARIVRSSKDEQVLLYKCYNTGEDSDAQGPCICLLATLGDDDEMEQMADVRATYATDEARDDAFEKFGTKEADEFLGGFEKFVI